MGTRQFVRGAGLAAVLMLAGLAGPAPAADKDKELREKILALNDITGDEPMRGELVALLKDPAGTKKLLAVAARMVKEKDQPLAVNATFLLARAAHGLKDFERSRQFYELSAKQAEKLQSAQGIVQSLTGLIDLHYEHKKYDECVAMCQQFLEVKGDASIERLKVPVFEMMIQALARGGKAEEALKLVDRLVKKSDEKDSRWYLLSLKAGVENEAGKHDAAAKTYEEVLQLIRKDKTLSDKERARELEQNRYRLSGVYIDLKEVDKAAAQLKTLMNQKPDEPGYCNDLGYIWADHGKNLEEAEKLIRKAIDLDRKRRKDDADLSPDEKARDNAAYLDSLGWVLFKQKKYKEAREQLRKAAQDEEGQHVEILDHLGDVHMALGEKAQAIAAWKKGVEVAGKSKREQERKAAVEKKLRAAGAKGAEKR